jgi:hypothetical protein
MKIACVGGGPGGLWFAIAATLHDPTHEITVLERRPPNTTYGWGIVYWHSLLEGMRQVDPATARQIADGSVRWAGQRVVVQDDTCEREADGEPFTGSLDGPAFDAMSGAMREVYGRDVTMQGQGGSIPLCNVFQQTFPDAEIMLIGVEEPLCLIHAPNESVDPTEIENMAVVEARFLQSYGTARR